MLELYRWKMYDIREDQYIESRTYGTIQGINTAKGVRIEETKVIVDEYVRTILNEGLTDKEFNPDDHRTTVSITGFPKVVQG